MRAVGKGLLGNLVVLVPVCAAHVPVRKPFLFGLEVLHLHVENTVVSDERFKSFVMVSCQPIYAESAKRSTNAAQAVLVYIRKIRTRFVNRGQVVAHTLSAVVAANLFVPRLAESG